MPENKSEEHSDCLAQLIDLIPDPVIVLDGAGTIVVVNNAILKFSSCTREQLIGKSFDQLSFVDEQHKRVFAENLKNRIDGSNIAPNEININSKNGEVRSLEIKVNRIKSEGKLLELVIFHDITERSQNQKQLKADLLDSEEKFRGITNSVRHPLILVNEKAQITYWNPAAENTFGYSSSEVIGKQIHDLIVPNSMCKEGKERIETSVKIFSETGTGYFTVGKVDLIAKRKDGDEFPVELSISPIKLRNQWNAVGVLKDTSNRKKAEQKLRESDQRYHALFNEAPLGVLVIDPQTASFVEFNDTAHLQLGYSREEFSKCTIHEIEAMESSDEIRIHLREMVNNGGGEFETLHRSKNGDIRNVLVTTSIIELSGKILLYGIFHDLTETRKAQNALVKSEAQYRQLVELAQAGIWVIDKDFTTTFVNPRMPEMLGYTESEMVGKNLFAFIEPSMANTIRGIMKEFNENVTKGQYEYAFPRKDGTRISASLAISTLTDDNGLPSGALAFVTDITQRKCLEDELRASEERFRAISNSAMDAIVLANDVDEVIYWNPAAEKTFGFSQKEAIGKKLSELIIPPKGSQSHCELLKELKHNSFSKKYNELSALRKDRTELTIDLSITSVELKEQKCLLAVVRDISERKQMEVSIKQDRDMLEDITENIGAGLGIIDRNYRILWTNNFLKTLSGNVTNKICYSTFNTLDSVCPDCGPKKIFEGAQFDTREYFNKTLHEKGLPCWFELIATPIKDKDGKVVAALELTVDITEKKELEEKICEERNKLEAITENLNASLMLINKAYKITWMNKFSKQLYGDIVNQTCYSAVNNKETVCPNCGVAKVFSGKAIDTHQLTINKNNKCIFLEITDTPMKDKDGNVVGVLELGMDITEIKKLQSELSKYSQRLEDLVKQRTEQLNVTQAKLVKSERLAAIGELAGMIGHDLRNPLSGIKNAAYFLKKKGKAIPESQSIEMLETIDTCVNYSNKIVSDLLDYSREIHLELKECSLKNLILESLAMVNVPEKVEVVNHIINDSPVNVDQDKIKRVFINLIKNGIEAMPNVGKLTIDSKEANGHVEICFADTGVGIPDEILSKLFTPLFTTKAQGMGFGLAICKRIIEAHGGTITVKTANGVGSTFTVTLPIESKIEMGGEKIWIEMPKFSLSTTTKT